MWWILAAKVSLSLLTSIFLWIQELGASSVKIQKEATACFAILHQQIGPQLKALSLSFVKDPRLKTQLQKCMDDNPYDPSSLSKVWPKDSLAYQQNVGVERSQHASLAIDVPKTNIFLLLPSDIVARLVGRVIVFWFI